MDDIGEDAEMISVNGDKDEVKKSSKKEKIQREVYLPGKPLEQGEELVCDESAYVMLHQAHTGAPCLSFDIIDDDLADNRVQFPLTSYIVAGTQAARTHVNNLIVMKMYNLHETNKEEEEEDDDDDDNDDESNESSDEDEDKKPKMSCALIKHQGCINRIRSKRIRDSVFAASWSELGSVNIWKLDNQLQAVEDANLLKEYESNDGTNSKPVYTFNGHQKEGFAIDWSSAVPGVLATGDCKRDIHIWNPLDDGTWSVDQRPLIGHTESVEDLQWSPNEHSVLASCSVDKSIRIWDCRAPPQKACMLTCENSHENDVNVISWNKNEPLILSGGDDGYLHVWDLRQFQSGKPIASFKHHTNHVTTVEWYPKESTVFASGGSDDQIAIWDLASEKDSNYHIDDNEINNLPPQLLFIHQGQQDVKELHWHPKLPGVILSTAGSGFNIFRTISV